VKKFYLLFFDFDLAVTFDLAVALAFDLAFDLAVALAFPASDIDGVAPA